MAERNNPILAITAEMESAHNTTADIGMFTIKSANRTLSDAALRPNPRALYLEFWYEGEVCCLFSDSNLGKSIYAVQMADQIAIDKRVLLVDCELTDKQFQMRYTDSETGTIHLFPEGLYRAEINPMTLDVKDYEEKIIKNIEAVALEDHAAGVLGIGRHDSHIMAPVCQLPAEGVDPEIFRVKILGND